MVWMRNCAGRSRRSQPRACERASARCARACVENGPELVSDAPGSAAFSSSERMRLRISAAAGLVKVMATIWPGPSTSPSRRKKRRVSRSVLPEPAGARTRIERAGSSASSRCAWSGGGVLRGASGIASLLVIFVTRLRWIFLDAAKRLQAAVLAGFGIVARVHFRAAGKEFLGELRNVLLPREKLL